VKGVDHMAETWQSLEGKVAPEIHASNMKKLIEGKDFARQWRDACIRYFSTYANPAAP
jgi:alpha-glucuronidase